MSKFIIPSVIGTVLLYFAAIYFRYEPIPNADPQPQLIFLWDRFEGRVCVALPPALANVPGVACTPSEIDALVAKQAQK